MPAAAAEENHGDSAATGFAQALLVAGFDGSAPSLPPGAQDSTGSSRATKIARPQSTGDDAPAAAPPFRLQPFSGMTGTGEPAQAAQSSSTEIERQAQPTDAEVVPPAQAPVTAPPDAEVDSVSETSTSPALALARISHTPSTDVAQAPVPGRSSGPSGLRTPDVLESELSPGADGQAKACPTDGADVLRCRACFSLPVSAARR